MKLVKVMVVVVAVLCIAALPVLAKQGGTAVGKAVGKVVDTTADTAKAGVDTGSKVANEIADAITQPLSGESAKTSGSGSMPPGLAKKDKTPPGWNKGEKTGWNKDESKGHQDSVIDKVVKTLFGPKQQ